MLTQTDLLGCWRLVSCVETKDGATRDTFGPSPQGQIQYSADGRMSAFMMHQDWPATPSDGRFNPDVPFFSYAGAFELADDRVTHKVDLASQPFFVGQNLRRNVQLAGDRLTLTSDADLVGGLEIPVQTLVWQRVAA